MGPRLESRIATGGNAVIDRPGALGARPNTPVAILLTKSPDIASLFAKAMIPRATVASIHLDGLEQEFADLFREHYPFIYRTAYSITGNRQDSEDVAQAIFLKLLQREAPVKVRANIKAYLYRATVNEAVSSLRLGKRRSLVAASLTLEPTAQQERIERDDIMREALLVSISKLRPRMVEILILHYEHNYSDREIAAMLNTSRGVIAVTLHRARARLRKLMLRELARR